MQEDQLLQKWKEAKQICWRVIDITNSIYFPKNDGINHKLTKNQFMSVYDVVYNLCITKEKEQNRVTMVYKEYKQILKEALVLMCQDLHMEHDLCKLVKINKIWMSYTEALKKLNHMFAYLNRPFHVKEGKIQQLQKTGYDIIFTTLFNDNAVKEYELIYFKQIAKIRQSKNFINADILKSLVAIFYAKHFTVTKQNKKQKTLYTDFNTSYSRITRQYYQKMSKNLSHFSLSEYFKQIDQIYEFELKLGQNCYGMIGEGLFSRQFAQQFVEKYKPKLTNNEKGFKLILKNKEIGTLKIIVDMLRKFLKNVDIIKEQFQEFVEEQISGELRQIKSQLALIKKSTPHLNRINYCKFMQRLIDKNQQFLYILHQSFFQIGDFGNFYKCGMEKAFASNPLQIPLEEILAIYVDTKLKLINLREDQLATQVTNIISIFSCLQSKDLFLRKYTTMLCKRMTSINSQLGNHQRFIENLKLNCGMCYTQKLEILLTELAISQQNNEKLQEAIKNQGVKIAVNLKIFGEGVWPSQDIIDLPIQLLPQILQKSYNGIIAFYLQVSKKKTLKFSFLQSKVRWVYYLNKNDGNVFQQSYFDTNTIQAIIIYYIYNQQPRPISLKKIEEYLEKVPSYFIKENLNCLCQQSEKILLKGQMGDEITYEFNKNLKTKKKLINFDFTLLEEDQKLFQHQDLNKDREILLDANISKFMKSHKLCSFQVLQLQILKMVKIFVPSRRDIKDSLDRLISKEIIKRDDKDNNKIRYAE